MQQLINISCLPGPQQQRCAVVAWDGQTDRQMDTRPMHRACSIYYVGSANTHTHPFNGPFSGITQVSRYHKGKTKLDFTEARDSEWQWHQLGHMQVCTWPQTDNHASTPPLSFYRPDALPANNQQRQSTEGTISC